MRSPYQAYQQTNVKTSDQLQLIVMLYEGAIRFARKGQEKIVLGDVEGAHNYIIRSREIVLELLNTLRTNDTGGVGQNLKRLYVYLHKRLIEANLTKDEKILDEAIGILLSLRDGWAELKKRQNNQLVESKKVSLKM